MSRYIAVLCLKPRHSLIPGLRRSPEFESYPLEEISKLEAEQKLRKIMDNESDRYVFGSIETEKPKAGE